MLKCLYCQAEDSFVRVGIYAAAPRTLKNMNSVPSSLWGNSFSGWVLLVVESKVHRLLSRETSLWRASEVREMSQKHADYILLQVPQGSECWAKCALGFSQYRIEKKILPLPEALSQAQPVLDPAPRPPLPPSEMQMSPGLQPALRE